MKKPWRLWRSSPSIVKLIHGSMIFFIRIKVIIWQLDSLPLKICFINTWELGQCIQLIFLMSIKHYSSKAYYFGAMGVTTKHIVSYDAKGLFPFGTSDYWLRSRETLWRLSCSYREIVSLDPCLHKARHHWYGIEQHSFRSLLIASGPN